MSSSINFWTSIATILSVFLALGIFLYDKWKYHAQEKQKYLHQLYSLMFELKKNNDVILKFFEKDRDAWLKGEKIGFFRYSTNVTLKLITDGAIRDMTLLRNLDAIMDNEIQVNMMLDSITLMGQNSQIGSQGEREMFARRISGTSLIMMNLNDTIQQYMPKVISNLKIHTTSVESKTFFS